MIQIFEIVHSNSYSSGPLKESRLKVASSRNTIAADQDIWQKLWFSAEEFFIANDCFEELELHSWMITSTNLARHHLNTQTITLKHTPITLARL